MSQERLRRQNSTAHNKTQPLSSQHVSPVESAPLDLAMPVYANGPLGIHRMLQLQRTVGNKAVQQMVQRQPLPIRQRSMPSVQRAFEIAQITGVAHLRKRKVGNPSATPPEPDTVDTDTMVGHKIKKGTFVQVDEANTLQAEWVLAKSMGYEGYIRKTKYKKEGPTAMSKPSLTSSSTQNPEEESGVDQGLSSSEEMGGVSGDMAGDIEDRVYGDLAPESQQSEKSAGNWGIAGGSLGTFQGLAGLAKNIRGVLEANGGMEKFESIMEIVGSVGQTGTGISKIVDSSVGNSGSKSTAGGFDGANEIFSGVVSTYSMIKTIVTMAKALFKGQLTGDEAFHQGMEAVKSGLDGAMSGIKAARTIKETFLEVPKTAMGGLNAAIPGLGIALSAVDIILQVYKIVKAGINISRMNQAMQSLEGGLGSGIVTIKTTTKGFFKKIKKERLVVDEALLDQTILDLESNTARTVDEEKQLKTLKEYKLARTLKSLNTKRIVDASVSIFADFLSIAGDIATLSGLAAPAGIALKMIAGTTKITYEVVGKIVQYLKDRKAIKTGGKTSEMKRRDDAKLIIQLVVDLPTFDPANIDIINQYKRVHNYLIATGVNIPALNRETDVTKQFGMLVSSMRS